MGKSIPTEKRIEYFKNMFPLVFNEDITLFILNDEVKVSIEPGGARDCYFNLVDNHGYKYFQSIHHVLMAKKSYNKLNRFFYNNPYTYDNINHYFELNNIDLHINGENLPLSGCARQKFDFVKSNGTIIKVSWNQIQKNTFRYKRDYNDVKQKTFLETHMTKEKAIPIILNKYKELGRPLVKSDFEKFETSDTSIGIRVILRIWGTFVNMVKDLGLPEHDSYFKPNDKNYHPHDEVIDSIKNVCEKVKLENRTTIMYSDFKKLIDIDVSTIRRHCELDGTTLNEVIKEYGCELQRAGNGLNYKYDDGEKTVSKYEYDFSNFLRDNGFIFGKDYFRNIPYKSLDVSYNGNMNCDYLLILNNKKVYIELAGILGNKAHQDAYRNNIPIKSKSKELYRQSLYQKRDIFERNNLDYYILLKDDMNENTYTKILQKYIKEAA